MLLRWAAAYAAAALVFCVLDALWLGVVARRWYRARLGGLLREAPRWGVALAFYLVYLAGLLLFGVQPALRSGLWSDALLWGGLFGFFTYFTYDMTSLATLKGWPPQLVAVDIAWGTVLNALAAAAGWAAGRIVVS